MMTLGRHTGLGTGSNSNKMRAWMRKGKERKEG